MKQSKVGAKALLRPAVLHLYRERLPITEMKRLVDARPLHELEAMVVDGFQQILLRAQVGDDDALASYFCTVRQAVMSFDNLVLHEEQRLRSFAEQSSELPVLLSLNPQTIDAAKERLRLLNVGAKAMLPTRSGQRSDRRNFWTRLALAAFEACRKNKQSMAEIEAPLAGAKQSKFSRELWSKQIFGTAYTLADGTQMKIEDWQKDCAQLGEPDAPTGSAQWWTLAEIAVRDFWIRSNADYIEALKNIGSTNKPEHERRNAALKRTQQAFKSLFLPKS